MELREEYEKQQKYRSWLEILELLPIDNNQIIADLGCGIGEFTEIVSEKVKHVIAVDRNRDLLNNLKEKNIKNVNIVEKDIMNIDYITEELDGIFSSFTIAYFPNDMKKVIENWAGKLKSGGWIALIEIDDLLRGHQPLSEENFGKLARYEEHIKESGKYDFQAGRKIKNILKRLDMEIIIEKDLEDIELTASGIMSDEVFEIWKNRLNRLNISKYYPEKISQEIKKELLSLFKSAEHENNTKVKFIVAKKI